jgi:hypothetical protein
MTAILSFYYSICYKKVGNGNKAVKQDKKIFLLGTRQKPPETFQ